jgi:GNAT superfamily N-acetyltransferase
MPDLRVDARNGVTTLEHAALGRALIESDRQYFELGARRTVLTGAEIAWLDGMADLPAAGVVHRVVPGEVADPAGWVAELTAAQRDIGFTSGRVYLDEPCEPLEHQFVAEGWTMRREPALIAVENVPPSRGPNVELLPVVVDADWDIKQAVHLADGIRPDGHPAPASRWVAMEQARVATGRLDAWLVRREGIVCGTVLSMAVDGILRMKNLVVHPDHRRTGVGLGVLGRLDVMARERALVLGTFSVAGDVGELLYRAAAMQGVVEQREWSRRLDTP